jgi:hypothetical protein
VARCAKIDGQGDLKSNAIYLRVCQDPRLDGCMHTTAQSGVLSDIDSKRGVEGGFDVSLPNDPLGYRRLIYA